MWPPYAEKSLKMFDLLDFYRATLVYLHLKHIFAGRQSIFRIICLGGKYSEHVLTTTVVAHQLRAILVLRD